MKMFFFGLILTLGSWILAWQHSIPLSQHSFFPLWFGYILTINGASQIYAGKSLLTQMGKNFWLLFIISIPFWWFFEGANLVTRNWQYNFPQPISSIEYILRASMAFSTVIPAVLSTTFIFHKIISGTKKIRVPRLSFNSLFPLITFSLGVLSFFLVIKFPQFTFPLLWIGVFLLLEPINYILGLPSLLRQIKNGKWDIAIALATATLFTGFWWELWNFYSLPKWTYSIPYVGFFKIFEMPILGFLGYPFFGLEVYAFTNFCFGITKRILKQKIVFDA